MSVRLEETGELGLPLQSTDAVVAGDDAQGLSLTEASVALNGTLARAAA
ncbi:hypothetical protein MKK63_16940 [Methylobacterium sp. J-088]|nr:hypothetical protein [Methylobacterium sp. J-088]MCJ2064388.1 hypothetical protein [Methylobacterium sp. J-088]